MPWVRLDDRFPSHRKVALLSDRAFRLYVSALCWSSENLTEGRILDRELPVVARLRGTQKAASELEEVGLWDRIDGGWEIHDYLEYNPDRARVHADREANAARQKAWRERKRAEREAKKAAEGIEASRNADRNAVTGANSSSESESRKSKTRRDGDTTERETDLAKPSSPQVAEIRNGVSNGAPSRPLPLASPTEKQASYAREPDTAPVGPAIPDFARDLVDQLTAAGMDVGWRLGETEWFAIHAHIKRATVPRMVAFARARWNPANPPQTARYLTRVWADMPSAPEPSSTPGVVALPAAAGWTGPQPVSRLDQKIAAGMELARRLEAEENQ